MANGGGTNPVTNLAWWKWLLIGLGALICLVGFLFFTHYAFENYWKTTNNFIFFNIGATVIAFIVSFFVGIRSESETLKLIKESFMSALFASVFVSCIFMIYSIDKIDSYFNSNADLYSKVIRKINNDSKSDVSKKILQQKLDRLSFELSSIDKGTFQIPENDILNFWESLVANSKRTFHAINIVPDWSKVSRDPFGINPQLEALKNGVSIERIYMMDDTNKDYSDKMQTLLDNQKKGLINDKFTQKIISKQELRENSKYRIYRDKLGTDDIVIVDDEIVLLTYVNEKFDMQYSKVSVEPDIVDAAKQLFTIIERDLDDRSKQKQMK